MPECFLTIACFSPVALAAEKRTILSLFAALLVSSLLPGAQWVWGKPLLPVLIWGWQKE